MRAEAAEIVRNVAEALGGSPAEVMAGKRNKWACRVRHMSALILRRTGLSFPQVGQALGGFDHTTAINSCRRAALLELEDEQVAEVIRAEMERIAGVPPVDGAQHRRLAAACSRLIEAIAPGWWGERHLTDPDYLPVGMEAMADAAERTGGADGDGVLNAALWEAKR